MASTKATLSPLAERRACGARIFPAADSGAIPQWLSQLGMLPSLWESWALNASLHPWAQSLEMAGGFPARGAPPHLYTSGGRPASWRLAPGQLLFNLVE